MLSEPPDDLADRIVWRREAEETFADKVRRRLTQIVVGAYDAYLGTLTAAGDLSAFDSIPQQWGVYVLDELSDDLDEMYKAGAITAWNTAPTTTTLPTSAATGWAQIIAEDALQYQSQATNRLVGVGDDIWRQVNSQVTDALQKGASTEDLKKGIERITTFSEQRADTIARTEMNAAFVNGAYQGEVALGEHGPVYKEWLPVGDNRMRPEHEAMMGQPPIPFGDDFIVGDEPMAHPLADGASAGNVVNCRCDVLFFYPGDTLPDGTLVEAPATMSQNVEIGDEIAAAEEIGAGVSSLLHVEAIGEDILDDLAKDADLQQLASSYTHMNGRRGIDLSGPNDPALEYIARQQGFDGLPDVVSSAEFDRRLGGGDYQELWRGLTEQRFVDQFKTGDYFAGQGLSGSGTYTTTVRETAVTYTKRTGTDLLRMALRRDARTITVKDARRMMLEDLRTMDSSVQEIFEDEGRWAAARGYDAIIRDLASGEQYWVVLNRSALMVEA